MSQLAATLRQTEARLRTIEAEHNAMKRVMQAAGPMPSAPGMANPQSLGSGWDFLKQLPWSDRRLVQSHAMTFQAEVLGLGTGPTAADGVAVTANAQVVAEDYFFVHTLEGRLEYQLSNVAELTGAQFLRWQLQDDSRNAEYGRTSMPFAPIVGPNATVQGAPLKFDTAPMGWYPNARIIATFFPMAGFGEAQASGPSDARNVLTRQAEITLHGIRVRASLVDHLIKDNDKFLASIEMVGKR